MPKRISEQDLVLPALFCIDNAEEISTTDLMGCLRDLLQPQGEDTELLKGRTDDKFSQKVRNLQSHETLEGRQLAVHERRGNQGYWKITAAGKDFLEFSKPLLDYLIEQHFDYDTQQTAFARVNAPDQQDTTNQLALFDETVTEDDVIILEGRKKIVKQQTYERSTKLHELAINHFTVDGQIVCRGCGFNFGAVYGLHGAGYIEIHHLKPIFTYGDENVEKTLEEALGNVVPVCANCHVMIHRKRDHMLSIEELKAIIQASKGEV
jgi:hypothetical protein